MAEKSKPLAWEVSESPYSADDEYPDCTLANYEFWQLVGGNDNDVLLVPPWPTLLDWTVAEVHLLAAEFLAIAGRAAETDSFFRLVSHSLDEAFEIREFDPMPVCVDAAIRLFRRTDIDSQSSGDSLGITHEQAYLLGLLRGSLNAEMGKLGLVKIERDESIGRLAIKNRSPEQILDALRFAAKMRPGKNRKTRIKQAAAKQLAIGVRTLEKKIKESGILDTDWLSESQL